MSKVDLTYAGLLAWIISATVVFIFAATFLRTYVDNNALPWLAAGLLLYLVGNLMMVPVMREGGLGFAISLSAVLQLLMANGVAYFWFSERPGQLQMLGIGLGVIAVTLIMWPQNGTGQ